MSVYKGEEMSKPAGRRAVSETTEGFDMDQQLRAIPLPTADEAVARISRHFEGLIYLPSSPFWPLIEITRYESGGDFARQVELLMGVLAGFPAEDIEGFQDELEEEVTFAGTYRLWLAASQIDERYASGEGYEFLCGWLVAQGKAMASRAMSDPTVLIKSSDLPVSGCRSILDAASEALRRKAAAEGPSDDGPIGEDDFIVRSTCLHTWIRDDLGVALVACGLFPDDHSTQQMLPIGDLAAPLDWLEVSLTRAVRRLRRGGWDVSDERVREAVEALRRLCDLERLAAIVKEQAEDDAELMSELAALDGREADPDR